MFTLAHRASRSLRPAVQFERTLIIAEDDSQVSYLEGCTAPSYDTNQVSAMQHTPDDHMTMRSRHRLSAASLI